MGRVHARGKCAVACGDEEAGPDSDGDEIDDAVDVVDVSGADSILLSSCDSSNISISRRMCDAWERERKREREREREWN